MYYILSVTTPTEATVSLSTISFCVTILLCTYIVTAFFGARWSPRKVVPIQVIAKVIKHAEASFSDRQKIVRAQFRVVRAREKLCALREAASFRDGGEQSGARGRADTW